MDDENLIILNDGKASSDVAILIPKVIQQAVNLLMSKEIRKSAEVAHKKPYIFASTRVSPNSADGSSEVHNFCARDNIEAFSATKNRHRQAPLYNRYAGAMFRACSITGDIVQR